MNRNNKLNVLLTFGGRSLEHGVSLISASNLLSHFDPLKYCVNLLYIDREGKWTWCDAASFKTGSDLPEDILSTLSGRPVHLTVGQGDAPRFCVEGMDASGDTIDVVFTVLHGRNGAGGIMQGFWNTVGIPAAGPSLLGGAVGFDKDVMKRLLVQAGLPVCRYDVIHRDDDVQLRLERVKERFGIPFFIKPANSGSSLGVHKIYAHTDLDRAVEDVFSYDTKLIAEEYVEGSELEIYVFQRRDEIQTSVIRRTIVGPEHAFYTYEAKYGTENATANTKTIPADIPPADYEQVKNLAVQAYKVLEGRGEVRLDLFYSSRGEIFINEINTVPALMSPESQPSLWQGCGISQGDIIDALITSALD